MRERDDLPPSSAHLNPPALEKEVEPAKPWLRRGRTQLAIVAACLAVIAASGAVVWVRVARFWIAPARVATSTVETEAAVEVPTAALASDDPIGPPVTGALDDDADGWRGVAASPDQFGVVALWTERSLWVSRDDGRTFRQELAAPEPIGAATIGEDGRVFAARHGGRFGVLTPGGETRWLRLDYDQALAIAQGGSWTVLLTMSADRRTGLAPILWATRDHGDSWHRLVAPAAGDLDNRLRVSPDGSVDLLVRVTGDLAPRMRHYRGHVDGRPFAALLDSEDPQPFGLGHDGSTVQLTGYDSNTQLEPYHLPVSDWDVVLGAGAGRTIAVADHRLLALEGSVARPLSDRVPGRVRALTSDGIGRSLAIVGRIGLRHSAAHGWRRLFDCPADDIHP